MGTDPSFLSPEEIKSIGFGAVGRTLRISRYARFYGPSLIHLGDDVRIDDFAVLSAADGGIHLEGYNHIAVGALVFGEVTFKTWSTLSSRSAIYARSDDFVVDAHTYPHVADGRAIVSAKVLVGSRVVIGTGSTVLPGVEIADGVSVGAMSLVIRSIERPGVYAGIPARFLRDRQPIDT
jgi:galactoside O-acetyltransferase